jgi:hypothetical protein
MGCAYASRFVLFGSFGVFLSLYGSRLGVGGALWGSSGPAAGSLAGIIAICVLLKAGCTSLVPPFVYRSELRSYLCLSYILFRARLLTIPFVVIYSFIRSFRSAVSFSPHLPDS